VLSPASNYSAPAARRLPAAQRPGSATSPCAVPVEVHRFHSGGRCPVLSKNSLFEHVLQWWLFGLSMCLLHVSRLRRHVQPIDNTSQAFSTWARPHKTPFARQPCLIVCSALPLPPFFASGTCWTKYMADREHRARLHEAFKPKMVLPSSLVPTLCR
jgi:hypothetical protein